MERTEFDSDKKQFISWMNDNYGKLSDGDRKRLLDYGELIIERGASLGLVSRKDLPRLFMRHLREVAAPAFVGLARPGSRVVDIGSGAGLPGIPLAILRPDLDIVLVEPRHRRAGFLERTVMQLGLKQTRVVMASLDAFAPNPTRALVQPGGFPGRELDAAYGEIARRDHGPRGGLHPFRGSGSGASRCPSRAHRERIPSGHPGLAPIHVGGAAKLPVKVPAGPAGRSGWRCFT